MTDRKQSWCDYQKEADKAKAGEGGAARPIYTACKAQCLYCGMGIGNTDNPEMQFDVWRHLTIDHIIPKRIWPLPVVKAMEGQSRKAISEKSVLERLWYLNQICSCHLCNVRLNRYPNQEHYKNDEMQQFWGRVGLEPKQVGWPRGWILAKWDSFVLDRIEKIPSCPYVLERETDGCMSHSSRLQA